VATSSLRTPALSLCKTMRPSAFTAVAVQTTPITMNRRGTMEYQVTKIETHWVQAETREEAVRAVLDGRTTPEAIDYEVNG